MTMYLLRLSLLLHQRLNVPDALRILVDTPIAREESHTRHSEDSLGRPRLCVLVCLVNQLLRLHVRSKVVGDQVVVAVLDNTVEQRAECSSIAETTFVDLVKHLGELRLELVVLVQMCVAQVLDILCEVTEEKNVLLANLACNLDLSTVRLTGLGNS